MSNKPPFSGNPHGACTVFAVANLLHFMPDQTQNLIDNFPERPKSGYLLSDVQAMLDFVTGGDVCNGILRYGTPVNKDEFFGIYPFWELSENIFSKQPDLRAFVPFLLYTEKGGIRHVVAAYLSLENMLLTVIDSAGAGSVIHTEVNQYFSENKVVGVCMMLLATKTGFIPYLIEDKTIKSVLYGQTEKV